MSGNKKGRGVANAYSGAEALSTASDVLYAFVETFKGSKLGYIMGGAVGAVTGIAAFITTRFFNGTAIIKGYEREENGHRGSVHHHHHHVASIQDDSHSGEEVLLLEPGNKKTSCPRKTGSVLGVNSYLLIDTVRVSSVVISYSRRSQIFLKMD